MLSLNKENYPLPTLGDTGIAVLNGCRVNLEDQLRADYAYNGRNNAGYSHEVCSNIIHYLKRIFGEDCDINSDTVFLSIQNNENLHECCVHDINWLFLQDILWKKMSTEGFLTLTIEESDFFEALYHVDSRRLEYLLSCQKESQLINTFQLIQYPALIKDIPATSKRCLIDTLFFRLLQATELNSTVEDLLKSSVQFLEFSPDDCDMKKAFHAVLAGFSSKRLELQRQILKMLPYLPPTTLQAILQEVDEPIHDLNDIPLNHLALNYLWSASEYCLSALDKIITAIETLPEKQQHAIWSYHPRDQCNLLLQMAQKNPDAMPLLIAAINKLDEAVQDKIWSETEISRTSNGVLIKRSAWELIAVYHPEAIPRIIQATTTFPLKLQNRSWAGYRDTLYRQLMEAIVQNRHNIGEIINTIKTLPVAQQAEIWIENYGIGLTPLIFSFKHYPTVLPQIIAAITTLPAQQQEIVWAQHWTQQSTSENEQDAIFKLVARTQPALLRLVARTQATGIPLLVDNWKSLPLNTQKRIADRIGFFEDTRLKDFKKSYLKIPIAKLRDDNPVEKAIKLRLQSMSFKAEAKQIAILTALNALKEQRINSSEGNGIASAFNQALNDPHSALYLALNKQRYGLFSFSKETKTLQSIRKLNFSFFNNPLHQRVPTVDSSYGSVVSGSGEDTKISTSLHL